MGQGPHRLPRNRPYDTHLFKLYNQKSRHFNVLTDFNGLPTSLPHKNGGAALGQPRRFYAC
jgi:hypothetical protein